MTQEQIGMMQFLRDFKQHSQRPRRLFAAGRIGPTRQTSSGETLRLVATVGTGALRIREVVRVIPPQPDGPRAA